MNFLHDILLREFPHVRLRFVADSLWYRVMWRLLGGTRGTVTAGAKYMYFESEEQYMYMDGMRLMEVLAHEYTHFWQRAHDPLFMVWRWKRFVLTALCVGLAFVFWSFAAWSFLFLALAVIAALPKYQVGVARQEFGAYRMAVLVRICMSNNARALPVSRYSLLTPTDESLRKIIDVLFSSIYGMQWTSRCMQGVYFIELRHWSTECLSNYFKVRLAFDRNNKYINTTQVCHSTGLGEPYDHVLTYFVTHRVAAHE